MLDTHKKRTISDPMLIERLEGQHSGQTKHRLQRVPWVIGMPVAINQNFDVAAGVVNGSQGILKKVRYFEDSEGRRYLKLFIVEITSSDDVEMRHLPKHHFPIFPDTTELKFKHHRSHRQCTIKRRQVRIEPGFAMTLHTAQGRTMKKVIVDLAGFSGTEPPYVMVSRATSLEGLLILRDFERKQVMKHCSEDLRMEFKHLEFLRLKTIVSYGEGDEVAAAERTLSELQEIPRAKGCKRKLDCGEVQGDRTKRKK